MSSYLLAFGLFILVGFSSCKKDDSTTPSTSGMIQGLWKVTSYIDSGNNETNHYTGYSFEFKSGGVVTATKSGSTISGTWSTGSDDSQSKLYLTFSTAPFIELNDDWHIMQQTSAIIKLEDVSGGNGGTDNLTFEKI